MIRFILTFAGICSLLIGYSPAHADKFKAPFETARAEMNALGNKALAGDAAAMAMLKEAYLVCSPASDCYTNMAARNRAAAAANNLGWLYWDKEVAGKEGRVNGMMFYAKAATLGSPQGAYQSGECIWEKCLGETGLDGGVFRDFKQIDSTRRHWPEDAYGRLELASWLFYQALNEGLAEAAVARTAVELELAQLASTSHPAGDEVTLALYSHLSSIVATARKGFEANPTDVQRQKLEAAIAAAQPQLAALESEAAAARARQQATREAPATPAPVQTPLPQPAIAPAPSKGANYEADKSRVRQCIADAGALDEWSRDLSDWKRDLNRWEDELYEELVTLELGNFGDERADYARLEADQRALKAEKADIRAERSDFRQDQNAYAQRCSGSFNANAVDEMCASASTRNDFCRSGQD